LFLNIEKVFTSKDLLENGFDDSQEVQDSCVLF
jgi:hypothetical protein